MKQCPFEVKHVFWALQNLLNSSEATGPGSPFIILKGLTPVPTLAVLPGAFVVGFLEFYHALVATAIDERGSVARSVCIETGMHVLQLRRKTSLAVLYAMSPTTHLYAHTLHFANRATIREDSSQSIVIRAREAILNI